MFESPTKSGGFWASWAISKSKYWKSSRTLPFSKCVLEMRKKLGAIQTQYLEKCVNTNRAGRTNADRYRETKMQLKMYRENKDTFNRKHALKNMRTRGLPPRPLTILKYNVTGEEIAECCKRV
ncbi:unnamed protein product [Bathycoccus prasinos]